MIVDDNPYIRESVEILLQLNGTKAINASGGEECLRQLQSGFRGVILMDIMMPFMDGWDTIREMVDRGLHDGNLIIMLTAMNEPTVKMHGLEEYVTDYITKPFTPNEFIEKLQFYLSFLNGAQVHEG